MTSFHTLLSRLLILLGLVAGTVASFAQTPQTLPNGRVGVAYSFQITTSPAAPAGSVYSATGLAPGLGVNAATGLISGTPTQAGTYSGSISITVPVGNTNVYAVVLTINPATGTPTITSATAASGTVGAPIATYTVTASVPAGAEPVTSFNIGALPPGLSVGGTATAPIITGTPLASGVYPVSLSANSAAGTGASTTLTFTIAAAAGAPVINSAATASGTPGTAFTYQITATNAPTSYSASGLPVGLSVNPATGLISGTPGQAGIFPITLRASNATGTSAAYTLTLTVGGVSAITSSNAASGTVGSTFSYTVTASSAPTSFNLSALPPGLSANTTTGSISGMPTTTGVYAVNLSANNALGQGPATTLTITIAAPSGGGGGGGIFIPPPVTSGEAPVITAQPTSQAVAAGANVTFSVSATGTSLSFQWRKNGVAIPGATANTLTLSNVSAADAGSYIVTVSHLSPPVAATSNAAVLTVLSETDSPVIVTPPAAQEFAIGSSVSLSVVATGSPTLTYQWFKDGQAITGATNATLGLANLTADSAGRYFVVVRNSIGSATSSPATLALRVAGTYFGSFGGNGGTFALMLRGDGTGVFLGYARSGRVALVSRDLTVDALGRFSGGVPPSVATLGASSADTPPVAALEEPYQITGATGPGGAISGTVSGLNLPFSAPAAGSGSVADNVAGYYPAGEPGGSAISHTIVGTSGDVFVLTITGGTADAGRGSVNAAGEVSVTTDGNARISGTVQPAATINLSASRASGSPVAFLGANAARADVEKLVNVSTRTLTGTAANTLIAGFVITGDQPKPVLVRAIGPTLASFNVAGALSAARLEVFRDAASLAVGNDWGAAGNAAAVASATTRVGAFALAANSRDAALLLTLEPGAYTAVVTGQGSASGVALVEVYDATEGDIPRAQRIMNVSTRATAGTGDNTLIAGFVISGSVPKRVLVRGVGPSLTQFGVTGALARPQLTVFAERTTVAQNTGWTTSPDAAVIAATSAQVGAFALGTGSADSAVILNLAPGAYTAQVTGVGATTGVALIEVYEVP